MERSNVSGFLLLSVALFSLVALVAIIAVRRRHRRRPLHARLVAHRGRVLAASTSCGVPSERPSPGDLCRDDLGRYPTTDDEEDLLETDECRRYEDVTTPGNDDDVAGGGGLEDDDATTSEQFDVTMMGGARRSGFGHTDVDGECKLFIRIMNCVILERLLEHLLFFPVVKC